MIKRKKMAAIEFKGESLSYRIKPTDQNGVQVPASSIQNIEARIFNKNTNEVAIRYSYVPKTGFNEITLLQDETYCFIIEKENMANSTTGEYGVQVTIDVTDAKFSEGFARIIKKGILFILKESVS